MPHDLTEHILITHAASDELGRLRAEVHDQDSLLLSGSGRTRSDLSGQQTADRAEPEPGMRDRQSHQERHHGLSPPETWPR